MHSQAGRSVAGSSQAGHSRGAFVGRGVRGPGVATQRGFSGSQSAFRTSDSSYLDPGTPLRPPRGHHRTPSAPTMNDLGPALFDSDNNPAQLNLLQETMFTFLGDQGPRLYNLVCETDSVHHRLWREWGASRVAHGAESSVTAAFADDYLSIQDGLECAKYAIKHDLTLRDRKIERMRAELEQAKREREVAAAWLDDYVTPWMQGYDLIDYLSSTEANPQAPADSVLFHPRNLRNVICTILTSSPLRNQFLKNKSHLFSYFGWKRDRIEALDQATQKNLLEVLKEHYPDIVDLSPFYSANDGSAGLANEQASRAAGIPSSVIVGGHDDVSVLQDGLGNVSITSTGLNAATGQNRSSIGTSGFHFGGTLNRSAPPSSTTAPGSSAAGLGRRPAFGTASASGSNDVGGTVGLPAPSDSVSVLLNGYNPLIRGDFLGIPNGFLFGKYEQPDVAPIVEDASAATISPHSSDQHILAVYNWCLKEIGSSKYIRPGHVEDLMYITVEHLKEANRMMVDRNIRRNVILNKRVGSLFQFPEARELHGGIEKSFGGTSTKWNSAGKVRVRAAIDLGMACSRDDFGDKIVHFESSMKGYKKNA